METLRIAFVYDVVYPWVKGGVEKRIHELARRLAKKHEVHVYGYKLWEGNGEIERDGVFYHGLAPAGRLYILGRRRPLPMLRLAARISRVRDDLRNCDVVDVQNLFYPGALALRGLENALLTWHEFWGNYWLRYWGPLGVFGETAEKALFSFERHAAVSWKTKLDLAEAGLRKPISLVPNGVDAGLIKSIPPAELESDIIFVGRLIPEKGVDLLLRALAEVKREIPDVRAVVVGDGPERGRLERLSARLGLEDSVLFTGFLESRDEVIAIIKASKVFVLPSRREGFGMVALEAMASGLPVVTLNAPMNAARFLVENGRSGFAVGADELGMAVLTLLGDKKLNRKMGAKGKMLARHYEWENVVGVWLASI
ncbi:glycosyltransferase family 4 protein [Thermococcus sp.]|uniref:glycosyltransferase family 4 protein n=1 Tax=Thermococcus sp. TaxID=35749 RepID=UPI0025DB9EEC|nr:glycosyltransferase family 4 protein [Thermococcus sp.]